MKKILFLIFLAFAIKTSGAVLEYDLRKGIDLTATNYLTGAMLNQIVDSGTISATNKGAIIRFSNNGTARWPNVTDNPRYTNFLWLDMGTIPPTIKSYVCCGDVFTNWVANGVSPGTVTTAEIRDYTILEQDMATNSVNQYALQANAVSGNKIADNGILPGKIIAGGVIKDNIAFGAIVGGQITNKTVTYTNIADGTIQRLQLAPNAVGPENITNGAVTTVAISATNITRDLIRDDAVGTTQITNAAVTTNKLAGQINSGLLHTNASYGLYKCWAFVNSDGTLLKGLNATAAKLATGKYRITFAGGFVPSATNYAAFVTAHAGAGEIALAASYYSNTTAKVDINIKAVSGGGSGNDTDSSFSIGILDQLP